MRGPLQQVLVFTLSLRHVIKDYYRRPTMTIIRMMSRAAPHRSIQLLSTHTHTAFTLMTDAAEHSMR